MAFEAEIPPFGALAQPPDEINLLAHRVIGIALEVHRELGPGLSEDVYERAVALELETNGIQFQRQYLIQVRYKGVVVGRVRLDFLIEQQLVLEIKSVETLTPIDRRQVLRYLELTKLPLGLLINFNVMLLKQGIKRVFRSEPEIESSL
jgi:GxxExxY protein